MAGIEDEIMLKVNMVDFEEKVKKVLPGELQYACLCWASHAMAAEHANKECVIMHCQSALEL